MTLAIAAWHSFGWKAGLDGAAALLGLDELAAALGAGLLGLALDPEALVALWQRWARAVPISTMYSKLALPRWWMRPRKLVSLTCVCCLTAASL